MISKEKNNLKRRLKRKFKKIDNTYKNENFEDVIYRDRFVDDLLVSKNLVFSLEDIERTKGLSRFYLLRYCYARHMSVIGNMDKNHIEWSHIMPILDKRRQIIIPFEKIKELLFPVAIIDPHRVSVWLKQYRKFYNKYKVLKRRINSMIEV